MTLNITVSSLAALAVGALGDSMGLPAHRKN